MRLIFYIFFISQLLNFLNVFAQNVKQNTSQLNSIEWEKIEEKSKPLKKIIWRSYNNDESYFEDKILKKELEKSLRHKHEKIKKITKTPIVAIGGINSYNYKKLLLNKANFLAISGYIWKNKKLKPGDAIKKLI